MYTSRAWLPQRALGGSTGGHEEVSRGGIYLVSCFLAGYTICPYIEDHRKYIENVVGLPSLGTHPMPANYVKTHVEAGDWKLDGADKWLRDISKSPDDADKYDSTNPNFLKK